MFDQFNRNIDYMRISVTDRCNLRCRYCTPDDTVCLKREDLLRYEEIERIAGAAVSLGITKFKITGGEPLVRKGCAELIASLKRLPGVQQLTMTTNGLLLRENLDALCRAGLDAVNISLDTLDEERYQCITGAKGFAQESWKRLLANCCARGLRTKVNAVLMEENRPEVAALAALAAELPIDVRFIELMPIGIGVSMKTISPDEILAELRTNWPDLRPTDEKRGNGPAHYYKSDALLGRIGVIDALSHTFCAGCNRVRLTSTGQLKPCLCFDSTADLRLLLRRGCTDDQLRLALQSAIYEKPRAHCFDDQNQVTEHRLMSQIGG